MSRKGENIYRRKDGRWEGRYIIERKGDGKYRYGYVYADTYQKVKQELVSRKSCVAVRAAQVKSQPAEKKPLLKDYAIKWLESVKYHVKESTYVKYWNLVHSYIIPELGDIPWDCLNRETAELFCSRMLSAGGQKKRGLSAKTVSDIMTVFHHIFRFASDHGAAMLFDISPIAIKKETREMQILTDGEQKKLCGFLRDNLDDRNLGILICMYAGLRLGEICALKWEDISLSEQIICVRHTMQRIQTKDDPKRKTRIVITAPKSQNSVRRFPIPDELAKILSAYQKGKQGFVLTGKEDSFVEPRTMERHFVKVLKLAGIRQINFHALRHTFATRCVELEFDVKSLSEILGHANVNITLNRYVHPTMEQKRKNMQKLSRLLAVS